MAPSVKLAGRLLREVYRRELLPSRARWWLVAAGKYKLTKTIPKHGGKTCRVDLVSSSASSAR